MHMRFVFMTIRAKFSASCLATTDLDPDNRYPTTTRKTSQIRKSALIPPRPVRQPGTLSPCRQLSTGIPTQSRKASPAHDRVPLPLRALPVGAVLLPLAATLRTCLD